MHSVVAERSGDGQELEIECESLHEQERYDLVYDLPGEDFQTDLRVSYVQAEQQPVHLLVEPAGDPPRARVLDDRVGMPLRPDREVELVLAGMRQLVLPAGEQAAVPDSTYETRKSV